MHASSLSVDRVLGPKMTVRIFCYSTTRVFEISLLGRVAPFWDEGRTVVILNKCKQAYMVHSFNMSIVIIQPTLNYLLTALTYSESSVCAFIFVPMAASSKRLDNINKYVD